MKKKFPLILIAFLCVIITGFAQGIENFTNIPTASPTSYLSRTWTGTDAVTWTAVRARTDQSINGKAICTSGTGSVTSPTYSGGMGILSFNYVRAFTGTSARNLQVWVNGSQIGATISVSATSNTVVNYSNPINITGNVVLELRTSGAQIKIDDISWTTATACTDAMDFANIQFPTASPQTITQGDNFDVYTQAVEPGVTDASATAAGPGVEAWIGYSSTNDDPSTGTGWTWVVAIYNADIGANDEHVAEIGSGLAPGTYYYASRYSLNSCSYTYGGTGGNWNNDSVELIVNPDQVDFCNVDYPKNAAITTGNNFNVYAQAYEPGVTNANATAAGPGLVAWIGYTTVGINHQPWNATGWTWVATTYDSDNGNNDQFTAEIGSGLTAGTYYFASRFQLNGSSYSYGGIVSDNVGNFWDATNNNGTLVVTDPPLADVVITEIMYNTTGTDDEWIEICNVSGSTQNLSSYTIDINGTSRFTFPLSTTIADGVCITIDITDGGGPYNPDCVFAPTYSSGNGTGRLGNSSGLIELVSPLSIIADVVAYDDGDGADGNGSSLHIIDINVDNSVTGSNWQEVDYGGSYHGNFLVSPCVPMVPLIQVEGDIGFFPDITSPDTTPSFLDNTRFTAQFIGSSEARSFRISNLGGVNLNITSVAKSGANPGDFTISLNPGTVTPGQNPPGELEITFSPLAAGVRTATITINNNSTNVPAFTFNVRGDGDCVSSSTTISPSSGPEGTIVTVNGSDFGGSTTATFNGVAASLINVISATQMEVTVPATVTGNLEIIDDLGCTGIIPFTVVDNQISSCQGVGNLSDLVMTEITDSTTGSLSYVEIYNGTGATVNLGGYTLEILQNGATSVPINSSYSLALNSVNLANDAIYVVALGTVGSPDYTDPGANTCTINISGSPVGNGELADQTTTQSGINMKPDKHDVIRLLNSGSVIDEFGVHEDENWMLTTTITGDRGFNFRRLNTSTLPNPTFNLSDWNAIDWVGSGLTSCSTNDYTDIGTFDYSSGTPPTVTTQPTPQVSNCDLTASFTVAGQEAYTGVGNTQLIAYQWYYSAPGDAGWTAVPNTVPYTGYNAATLNISNTVNFAGYQYYCQIREDDATCFTASNAVKLDVLRTTWIGGAWDNGAPDINTVAVIVDDYNSSNAIDGSFSACQLIINTVLPNKLTVGNSSYVEVQNNTIINGDLWVETQGSFVQNANIPNAFTINSGGNALVNKTTTFLNNWYDYTYWSSPITDETIGDALDIAPADRRFWFNAQNYEDVLLDSSNNTLGGSDDIDDNANDWQQAGGGDTMTPGVGYAATVTPGIFTPGYFQATFEGEFNNSTITTPIWYNGANGDNDWNFIGNPYPGALDFDLLYEYNVSGNDNSTIIDGAAYLWSQASPPLRGNDGNEVLNFNTADYAIITYMSGNTAGGDGLAPDPNNVIPSGQGFFIRGLADGTLYFDNSMRVADNTSNDQFFRSSNRNNNANRLWIDLTSDNGVFNQILVAYVEGGTIGNDGFAYDAPRNSASGNASEIYTSIENEDKRYAIQGMNPNDLNEDEIIPFGFYTNIDVATVYTLSASQFEGDFLTNNSIYLHDKLIGIYHDLSDSEYSFTSDTGEFNDRFEIVFNAPALSINENEYSNALTIVEQQNGDVLFTVSNNLDIENVKIYDALGRLLYDLKGQSNSEIINLSNLSKAAYIAKVQLSNGIIVTKKAIKRN